MIQKNILIKPLLLSLILLLSSCSVQSPIKQEPILSTIPNPGTIIVLDGTTIVGEYIDRERSYNFIENISNVFQDQLTSSSRHGTSIIYTINYNAPSYIDIVLYSIVEFSLFGPSEENTIRALETALEVNAPIVNISITSTNRFEEINRLIIDLLYNDSIVVVAAGNLNRSNVDYFGKILNDYELPENMQSRLLIVGCATEKQTICDSSNKAGNLKTSYVITDGLDTYDEENGRSSSIATARISLLLAILRHQNPTKEPEEIVEMILEQATNVSNPNSIDGLGYIDFEQELERVVK